MFLTHYVLLSSSSTRQLVFDEQVHTTPLCRSVFDFLAGFRGATDTRIKREWKVMITAAILASLGVLEECHQDAAKKRQQQSDATCPVLRNPSAVHAFGALASLLRVARHPTVPAGSLQPWQLLPLVPMYWSSALPPTVTANTGPCCSKNERYLQRVKNGDKPKGRPPHSDDCKVFVQQKIQALLKT